ncbi:MAG: hypothetical protein GY861_18030 [bacterium]|nr:hypothetical protein [bacterium]
MDEFEKALEKWADEQSKTLGGFENRKRGARWAWEWCNARSKCSDLEAKCSDLRTENQRIQKEFDDYRVKRASCCVAMEESNVRLRDALTEITNTTRNNDPYNHLADHLKWVAKQALETGGDDGEV